MYYHTDSPRDAQYIAMVAAIAAQNGQSLRIDVDSQGRLRVKRGESIWTPPMYSTPDKYRDGESPNYTATEDSHGVPGAVEVN